MYYSWLFPLPCDMLCNVFPQVGIEGEEGTGVNNEELCPVSVLNGGMA